MAKFFEAVRTIKLLVFLVGMIVDFESTIEFRDFVPAKKLIWERHIVVFIFTCLFFLMCVRSFPVIKPGLNKVNLFQYFKDT